MTSITSDHRSVLWIETPRLSRISGIALPMIAAALSTNIMTFVDTLMVAQLGEAALGGVGIGGQLFFLLLALILGLAAGVQAMVARRVGEDRLDQTGKVLNAGLVLVLLFGSIVMALGYLVTPLIFGLINNDPLVVEQGLEYLSTRLPSLLLMGCTLTFRSYWVGVSQAKYSMIAIITLSISNVLFNYMLIFGNWGAPRMDVAGAGLGSTLAIFVGLLVNVGFALLLAKKNGFLKGLPQSSHVLGIAKIAYPESVRQVLFSVGVVLMYILIGQIGTSELAAFHVIISICLIAYMPHIGIGGAATTLVGEALGREDPADAKLWGWQVTNVGLVVLGGLGLIIVIWPEMILGWFFNNPSLLALAVLPLQIAIFAHILDGYGKIFASAFIGAGATKIAMYLTLLPQYLFFLPLLAAAIFLGYGLIEAASIFLASTIVAAIFSGYVWHREKWLGISI